MIALLFSLALLQQDPAADAPAEAVQTPVSEETGAAPQASLDREAALADINAYLNGIGTLRADFVQVAPDGSAATGELAMSRPGRLRFEYDEPTPIRIIADGTTVAIEDSALETVDRGPLRSTPLWWLLKEDIDIARDAELVGMESEFGFLYVTLRDPGEEMPGEIMFVFAEPSYELREWFVTDAMGEITRVSLNNVETGMRLNPRLFVIPEAEDRRDSRRNR
ncbi:LolA family protein [Maricaulis virginensis]|uniref:Outer-membrane lipoprotein carrier protein n=1 Tax=Maricaulis virginensis TaxID=144022 RepID=A0A9W6MPD7_9PROT|nr:outer membrane lipoprotein carrier protein LolA [Maricaulis virginensis]GLK52856.1 outer-membrane lipoprotein carrier protein [Maricaulis virginensis]